MMKEAGRQPLDMYMSAWCLSDGSEARGSRQLNGLFLLFDARMVVLLAVVVVSSGQPRRRKSRKRLTSERR